MLWHSYKTGEVAQNCQPRMRMSDPLCLRLTRNKGKMGVREARSSVEH